MCEMPLTGRDKNRRVGSERENARARAPRLSCFVEAAALILLAARLSVSPAAAQTPSISWSTDILSRYVSGASGSPVYDKPVVQTELNVGFQNGFYLSLWGSKSLNAEAPTGNFGNEIDYAFG